MINESANVVRDGIALRPLDVDVTFVAGYGFPRVRGGPMHYADSIGLASILDDIRRFHSEEKGRFWTPSPPIVELLERGQDFGSLNQLPDTVARVT